MADVTVQVLQNGPLLVKGPVDLKDAKGASIPTKEETLALCRCGHSATKPFCDGSHKHVGFQG